MNSDKTHGLGIRGARIPRYLAAIIITIAMALTGTIIPVDTAHAAGAAGNSTGVFATGGGNWNGMLPRWWLGSIKVDHGSPNDKALGELFSQAAEAYDFRAAGFKIRSWENVRVPTIKEKWREALLDALNNCKKSDSSTQCANPRLVGFGFMEIQGTSNEGFYGPMAGIPDKGLETPAAGPGNAWNNTQIPGLQIRATDKVVGNDSVKSLADSKRQQGKNVVAVAIVLSESQLQQRGWYPQFTVSERVDLASANTLKTERLASCPAYYYVTAEGIDGYVKGHATPTTKYITPYGNLYNAVATGGSWTSAAGKKYGPFKGDWSTQPDKVNEVKEARDVACQETSNMNITYDFGNSVPGGVSETTGGHSGSSVTLDSKDTFTTAYAKGGIYKVTKQVRNATITVKTTNVKYYTRDSWRLTFKGWQECEKDKTIGPEKVVVNYEAYKNLPSSNGVDIKRMGLKCAYVGKKKPDSTGQPLVNALRDVYNGNDKVSPYINIGGNGTVGFWFGNYGKNNGWELAKDQTRTRNEATALKTGDATALATKNNEHKVAVGKTFNRGYPKQWICSGKIFTSDQLGKDVNDGECTVHNDSFQFENEVLGEWNSNNRWEWRYQGKEAFLVGSALKSNAGLNILNTALKPVSDSLQSIISVAYQDFVNVNCNRTDFEKFVNTVRTQQLNAGIPESKALKIDTNTDTNGTASTGMITRDEVPSLAEIVPRMMGSTLANGKTIKGLSIKDVTGKDDPTIDGQLWSQYSTVNGKYNVGYNADTDPVYSKECPFDCVADSNVSGVTSQNIKDSDVPDVAKSQGNYGAKAMPSDSKGNESAPVNTANMVFFRNNEWNRFIVDVYAPRSTGNGAGQYTYENTKAKSTVVNRNDGTPWYSTNGTTLTEMQALTGSSSWAPIFNVANKANAILKDAPTQLNSTTTTTSDNDTRAYHVQLAGQVNQFRIKSSWATENGNPLKFQFKWEYDAKGHVQVPDKITFNGGTTLTGNGVNVVSKVVSTKVDGKCLSQQNTTLPSPNLVQLNHDTTGSGTTNTDDKQFSGPGLGVPQRGWLQITFVRATGE